MSFLLSLPLLAAVTACQKIELEEYDFEKHICEFSDELVHMYNSSLKIQ